MKFKRTFLDFLLEINDSNGANNFDTYVSLLFHQPFSSLKLQLKAPTQTGVYIFARFMMASQQERHITTTFDISDPFFLIHLEPKLKLKRLYLSLQS